jgi:NAD(P)H-flavin reductase
MSLYANQPKIDAKDSAYLPAAAVVERVTRISDSERFFVLRPIGVSFSFDPGQFFMAGLPGWGEAPFSVASPAARDGSIEFCIKAVGNLTNAIHKLKKGSRLWVRGPFGRGFKVGKLKHRDILFIAGGIGIVPMRALIMEVLAKRPSFGRLTLLYGCKSPDGMLFVNEIDGWRGSGLDVTLSIDKKHRSWKGRVGVATAFIPGVKLDPSKATAVVIGPPAMYRFAVLGLRDRGIADEQILVSLERRMKCGLGKCGHCQINSLYACQEGPVFRLSELNGMHEAFD